MGGKFWGNVGVSAVVFLLVAFGVSKISASSTGITGVLLPEVKVSDSAEELLHSVALVRSAVKILDTDHMVDASFVIKNKGGDAIKNISIHCTLFDASGKEQGRNKWVAFKTVESHERVEFTFSDKMFISDSVVRSDCKIVDMQIAKAPKGMVHGAPAGHGVHETPAHDSGHSNKH